MQLDSEITKANMIGLTWRLKDMDIPGLRVRTEWRVKGIKVARKAGKTVYQNNMVLNHGLTD